MTVGSTLASIAVATAKNGKSIVAAIETAGVVVAAANTLLEQAKPLMKDVDVKAATDSLRKNAGDAAGKIGELFGRIGGAKDDLAENLAQARSEKELRKAIQDARQSVLENATTTITVSDLAKAKEKARETGFGPINTMPCCFVIATYRKLDFDKDLTDYISLYIGKAENAAEGIDKAISREGDPDVYADVKYKQNVHVYVYNCMPEEIDALYESLHQTFSDTPAGEDAESEEATIS